MGYINKCLSLSLSLSLSQAKKLGIMVDDELQVNYKSHVGPLRLSITNLRTSLGNVMS